MNPIAGPESFRRVLLPLEAEGAHSALLENAARLARSLELALVGLYVEDADLVAFADLPIAHQITSTAARVSGLNRVSLARHFEGEKARLLRRLTQVAAMAEVRHEFILRRGRPRQEIRKAALRYDILAVGGRNALLAGNAQGLLACAATALLFVPESPRAGAGPVAVVASAGQVGGRLIDLAARIAVRQGRALRLLAAGSTATFGAAYQKGLRDLAAHLPQDAAQLVAEAARMPLAGLAGPGPGLVVTDVHSARQEGNRWIESGTPLLVVRNDTETAGDG
tara:strand:- start:234795 stop:235637 length:843 start_codon:yes stop_codon:yes gene_type:complete